MRQDDSAFSRFGEFIQMAEGLHPELGEFKKWDDRGIWRYSFRRPDKKYYIDEILQLAHSTHGKDAVDLIRLLIFEHLAEATLRSPNPRILYTRFLEALLEKGGPSRVGIISFNFDCLLVEDFKRQTYVDYGVGFDFNNNRPSYRGGNPFRLVKPNGSLDWGICRTCDKLHLLPFNLRRTDYPLESCCADCDGPLYPYIVVPHEEYEGRINQVWQDAEALLRGADEVIVTGYSFPPYDRRVRALFGSTVSADCRITAIDYREDPEDEGERRSIEARIAEVFPLMQHQPKILLNGFHQFVDELG